MQKYTKHITLFYESLIGTFFDENTNELCIVMEMANGGDLDAKIT